LLQEAVGSSDHANKGRFFSRHIFSSSDSYITL
jgi:hypothetical protein